MGSETLGIMDTLILDSLILASLPLGIQFLNTLGIQFLNTLGIQLLNTLNIPLFFLKYPQYLGLKTDDIEDLNTEYCNEKWYQNTFKEIAL